MPAASTVLVVDDEPNLRTTLALILQRAGYSVTTAADAKEARQCLQVGAYDVAFLDIRMPEVSGLTLLAEIRKQYPEMPVLLLTAHASLESAIEAVRHGANDYLLKPIDPAEILNRVERVLTRQQQPRRRREIMQEMHKLLSELTQTDPHIDSISQAEQETAVVDPARFLQRGPITLDLHARQAKVEGKAVSLTPTAFDYLVTLVRHSPATVPYETLVVESQGYDLSQIEAKEMARWRIHELRKAIEPNSRKPRYIITVRGAGYRLVT
ncbi:MAG: response regulator transcription factor [Anaerolineae bacterium]